MIELDSGRIHVRRAKNGVDSTHPVTGKEIRALRPAAAGEPANPLRLQHRTWRLRHGCGFKLANDGVDTRALQHFLGHRNIMHTVRYAELRSDRFDGFWKD
jgi:site-specific recombinase XerD